MLYPQPDELTPVEDRVPVEGTCGVCSAADLAQYKVCDYRGWLKAVVCQTCLTLASHERIPAPPQEHTP